MRAYNDATLHRGGGDITSAFANSSYVTPYGDNIIKGSRPHLPTPPRLGRDYADYRCSLNAALIAPGHEGITATEELAAAAAGAATRGEARKRQEKKEQHQQQQGYSQASNTPTPTNATAAAGGGGARSCLRAAEAYILNVKNCGRRHYDEERGVQSVWRPCMRQLGGYGSDNGGGEEEEEMDYHEYITGKNNSDKKKNTRQHHNHNRGRVIEWPEVRCADGTHILTRTPPPPDHDDGEVPMPPTRIPAAGRGGSSSTDTTTRSSGRGRGVYNLDNLTALHPTAEDALGRREQARARHEAGKAMVDGPPDHSVCELGLWVPSRAAAVGGGGGGGGDGYSSSSHKHKLHQQQHHSTASYKDRGSMTPAHTTPTTTTPVAVNGTHNSCNVALAMGHRHSSGSEADGSGGSSGSGGGGDSARRRAHATDRAAIPNSSQRWGSPGSGGGCFPGHADSLLPVCLQRPAFDVAASKGAGRAAMETLRASRRAQRHTGIRRDDIESVRRLPDV